MGAISDAISSVLSEIPLSAVLRERLELAKDRVQILEDDKVRLQEENAGLVDRVRTLERQIAEHAISEEFVEHHGALFKRRRSGGYHECVYCPSCRSPMSSLQDVLPFSCKCGQSVNFTGNDLERVMGELEQ